MTPSPVYLGPPFGKEENASPPIGDAGTELQMVGLVACPVNVSIYFNTFMVKICIIILLNQRNCLFFLYLSVTALADHL